jgi:peptide/nickel transport system substrate-binding protein
MRLNWRFGITLVAFLFMAVPVSHAQEASSSVVVASPVDVETLEPHFINRRFPDRSVITHIFDVLVRRDAEGNYVPRLAESWEQVDETTWQFNLRQGVTFHNGEAFDAEAVRYSFERMQRPEFEGFTQLPRQTGLQEVRVVDDHTVQLITEGLALNMLYWLAEAYIVPPEYYAESSPQVASQPVGSGPYRFVEWSRDERVVLEANPDYYGGAPDIERLVFRVIPEASSRLNELIAGNVDLVTGLSQDQAARVNTERTELVAVQGLRKMHLGIAFNGEQEALQDQRVRQALNYAVDADAIIEALLGGYTSRLISYVNPPNDNPDLTPYSYDPERARELLAEAGYPDGFTVALQGPSERWGADTQILLVLAQYLQAVGVNAEVETMEGGTYANEMTNRNLQGLYYAGWAALVNPIVENIILTCGHIDNPGEYCNEEFDALIEEAQQTADDDARQELLFQAQEIIWEDAPWVFLWYLPDLYGANRNLEWTPRPDGYVDLRDARLTN